MTLKQQIHQTGIISTMNNSSVNRTPVIKKENTPEDYVARITSIFLPYIFRNISESKFMKKQENIKDIVLEIIKKR